MTVVKNVGIYEYEIDYLLLKFRYLEQRSIEDAGREGPSRSRPLPDIEAAYRSPPVQWLLARIQEAIWTGRRFRSRLTGSIEKAAIKKSAAAPAHASYGSMTRPPDIRIFLDVTATEIGTVQGGIAVVARALAKHGWESGSFAPVLVVDGVAHLLLDGKPQQKITFSKGDIYVIMDHYWDAFGKYPEFLQNLRSSGVHVATCIYDLIPLEYPALIDRWLTDKLRQHLPAAISGSDTVFSISQSAADDISQRLAKLRPAFEIHVPWFYIGMNNDSLSSRETRRQLKDIFQSKGRLFLSVGSMMPHKGHRVAIAAIEELWAEGCEDKYVILGSSMAGSPIEAFIRNHPMYGDKLLRITDATDEEVAWAYENADCLLQPSIAEGFGLPIIEANRHGLPIIASDIPVFRELGNNSLVYFECCNAHSLAERLRSYDKASAGGQTTKVIDWDESVFMLRDMLLGRLASDQAPLTHIP
jgi:glycosyltransferase involved in cell wall biosynthesis